MGHIRQINGVYYIDFTARGLLYSQVAGDNLEGAQTLLKQIEDKIAGGEALTIVRHIELPDFYERFLAQAKAQYGPRTAQRFGSLIRHFDGFLKKEFPQAHQLAELTPAVIESYRSVLAKTQKPKTANFTILLLRDVLEYGIKLGFLNDNPSLHLRLLPWPQTRQRRVTGRSAQVRPLLAQGIGLAKLTQLLKLSDIAKAMYFSADIPLSREDIYPMIYNWLRWSIFLVLGLLIYAQTFGFGFVYDDHEFIVNNPYIRSLGKLHEIWGIVPKTRLIGIYSFALNYYFNGLDARAYHIFNFIIHLLACGMVWALAGLLLRMVAPKNADPLYQELPFLIALVFLVHPCQTQAVTYVSQRFESMATFFYLSTVYCYFKARTTAVSRPSTALYLGAIVSAVLGLMTKEVAVTIPLMLLAGEWILAPFLKKPPKGLYIALGLGLLCFGLLLMRFLHAGLEAFTQSFPSQTHDGDMINACNYILTQMRVFLTFLRLLVFPVNQNLDYDYPLSAGILHPPLTLFGALAIAALVSLVLACRKNWPLIAFGLAWVLITFSINLAPRANFIWEHKLYLISFGFFLAVTAFLYAWLRPWWLLIFVFAMTIPGLAAAAFERNHVWQNDVTLWEDVAQKSPHKARVYANLGWAYRTYELYDEALYYLQKAVAMDPKFYKNYMNLGDVYYAQGKTTLALKNFNKALRIDPLNVALYVKRARAYKKLGLASRALADLTHSIRLRPNFDAYMERGMLWMEGNQPAQALDDIQQALKIEPDNYDALINRAGVYFCTKKYDLAIADLNRAQSMDPHDYKIYQNRSYCYMALGQKAQAMKEPANREAA